jgi:hypothetical protein
MSTPKTQERSEIANAHSLRPRVRNHASERPILFCGDMVRMIRLGRKTQTRRIIKPQPEPFGKSSYGGTRQGWRWKSDSLNRSWNDDDKDPYRGESIATAAIGCESPYGQAGDRLWVKETFFIDHFDYLGKLSDRAPLEGRDKEMMVYYAAEGDVCDQIPECDCSDGPPKLHPSIFMPRWASRITLEILKVRAERLQDISDADCLAEGILTSKDHGMSGRGFRNYHQPDDAFNAYSFSEPWNSYRTLWETINGKASWEANPWVWVIEFKEISNEKLTHSRD